MTTEITLPKWYDLHVHVRQGEDMASYIQSQIDMGCAGILAMPNTKPPVGKITDGDDLPYWSIENYLSQIRSAGGDVFKDIIVPLYLTKDTTVEMIEEGVAKGLLRACKYYPPHGTTNSDHGSPLQGFIKNGVLRALEENGIILCVHGEKHGLIGADYFDADTNAEKAFYLEEMPALAETYPNLKIVAEHITTKEAVDFVHQASDNISASITPQHLLYTVGSLLQGLKYHLYCLPLVKFEEDLIALQQAVVDSANTKFFAGTDSAPHTTKATPCGCAAGCFTGGCAPQLYAEGFEKAGCNLDTTENQQKFKKFLCEIGPQFYDIGIPTETFSLRRSPSKCESLKTQSGQTVVPLPVGLERAELAWSIKL